MQQVTRQYREFVPIEQLPDKYLGGYKSLHERYYNDTRFASSLAHHLGSSFTCELDSENETVSHPLTMVILIFVNTLTSDVFKLHLHFLYNLGAHG